MSVRVDMNFFIELLLAGLKKMSRRGVPDRSSYSDGGPLDSGVGIFIHQMTDEAAEIHLQNY